MSVYLSVCLEFWADWPQNFMSKNSGFRYILKVTLDKMHFRNIYIYIYILYTPKTFVSFQLSFGDLLCLMPQSLNWWVQSSFSGTHSARKHATWPLSFGDKLQIEHFRPQPWTLKTLPKGSNCIRFKYRFDIVMKRTHFF